MSMKTIFEFLPNENLLQCFHYLNIIDIFHSFDQLNHRFNSLIRNIPFSLNFQNIQNKFQCDQFCMKMSMDGTIKNQLYSLHLSNQNTWYPVHFFLSKFSLLQFSHLRSITLHSVTRNNWKSIQPMISSISELSSFRIIDGERLSNEIISVLVMTQLQTLFIPMQLLRESIPDINFSSIMHLSIYKCNFDVLFILFNNAPKLNYLKIKHISGNTSNVTTDDIRCIANPANNLKTLHIDGFDNNADYLFSLLKRTPNLENLIILCSHYDQNMTNANVWQSLITTSLPHLKNFKFKFDFSRSSFSYINEQSLKEFQNDFWYNEHHAYTEVSIAKSSASIYTIPYPSDRFEFLFEFHRYYDESIDNTNTFNNVKELIFNPVICSEKCQYHFSNVNLLSLGDPHLFFANRIQMNYSHLKHLQTMVNLSNIKHLTLLHGSQMESIDVFKEIIKSTTQLTSLEMKLSELKLLFEDDEICKYFTESIRKLKISYDPLSKPYRLKPFYKILINLKELKCSLNELDTLLLIKNLPILTYLEIYIFSYEYETFWVREEVQKLGLDITADCDCDDYPRNLFIWINRN
ncbi:unnamed protein product [Adineta steineri]|uniref:F-box domain-containing protein n=1 Tax=Adineta steineri TaxID=433720 RepID=A0A819EX34_9BILA|nr:unnamed protein product [Adineta steineri]CAF3857036.1 unnamed protein product [Adineta steineri]